MLEEPTPIKPFMFVLPLALFWSVLNRRRISRLRNAELAAIVFFLFAILSAFWARDMSLALLKVVGVILLFFTYYGLRVTMHGVNSNEFFRIISVGGVVVIALSLVYYGVGLVLLDSSSFVFEFDGKDRGFYGLYLEGRMIRMRGLFDSPNNLSLICVFLFFYFDNYKEKFSLFGKILVMVTLLLTLSLTAWLAVFVGFMTGMMIRRRLRPLLWMTFIVATIVSFGYFLIPEEVITPMVESRTERIASGSGRVELLEVVLEKISERPIVGYGLNQSRLVLKGDIEVQSTHNSFLEAAIDGGLVLSTIYLICWMFFLSFALRLSWRNKQPFYFSASLGLFIFSQSNLLTFVELTIFCYALWFEIASRASHSPQSKDPCVSGGKSLATAGYRAEPLP